MKQVWTDNESGVYQQEAGLVCDSHGVSVETRRLHGGPSEGVDLVTLETPSTLVEVVPTRGMGIARIVSGGVELKWDSPVRQLVNPALVDQQARNGLGWLSGFNEFLCRCGLSWNGAPGPDIDGWPLTLHGRVANLPAFRVEAGLTENGSAWVEGSVDETSLFGPCLRLVSRVEVTAGEETVRIVDEVINLGGAPAEFELLYHVNFGQPLLSEGARCVAAAEQVIPRDSGAATDVHSWSEFTGPVAGYAEQVYFLKLRGDSKHRTEVLLKSADARQAAGIEFSLAQLPCFTLWKNTQAAADGYCVGLEPGTDYPNHRSFERTKGRLMTLDPGAKWSSTMNLNVYSDAVRVAEAESRIRALASGEPELLTAPDPDCSP